MQLICEGCSFSLIQSCALTELVGRVTLNMARSGRVNGREARLAEKASYSPMGRRCIFCKKRHI